MLAAARFPKQGNGKRFVALVRTFAGWPDAERVSLQQIQASKRSSKCPALKAEVARRLDGWERGALTWHGPQIDPLAEELTGIAESTTDEATAATDLLDRCGYVSLLWQLRNFRVHEGRSPASEFPLNQQPLVPYYSLWGLSEARYQAAEKS